MHDPLLALNAAQTPLMATENTHAERTFAGHTIVEQSCKSSAWRSAEVLSRVSRLQPSAFQ